MPFTNILRGKVIAAACINYFSIKVIVVQGKQFVNFEELGITVFHILLSTRDRVLFLTYYGPARG